MEFLIASIFLVLGFGVGFLWQKNKTSALAKDKEYAQKQAANHQENFLELQKKYENILQENAQKQTEIKNYHEKLETQKQDFEKLQKQFAVNFENLANKILEEKSEKFTHKNKENIEGILKPLQEKIKDFEQKVVTANKESFGRHQALKEQIINLKESNRKISEEAINLTKALKGDIKTQGNWGELILEKILEKSGLREGKEYEREKSSIADDSKRQRPDVVINLPGNRNIIVDSKVSLMAYERYWNCENTAQKKQFLKAHLHSLQSHVKRLSEKNYDNLLTGKSPDFVLMFMPIEPAFAIALEEDRHLFNDAFDKNIVIVTPTTLLATLRTIESLWRNEKQQQNAIEIAKKAGALYDKFVGFSEDLIRLGKQMNTAQKTYGTAMNKLCRGDYGNLLASSENLKRLGAKAKKQINPSLLERSRN